MVRLLLVRRRRRHIVAKNHREVLVVALHTRHTQALKGYVINALINPLGVLGAHPLRPCAQLGNAFVLAELVLCHMALSHTPNFVSNLFAPKYSEQNLTAEGHQSAVVFGHNLRQKQRVNHCPDKLHFTREPSVGGNVERKNVEHKSVGDIHRSLVCLYHCVIGVGDSDEDVAGEHFVVGFQKPEPAVGVLFAPESGQFFIVLTRKHNVNVVVPRHKSAVSERADKASADEVEGQVIFFAKVPEILEHRKLLKLQLAQKLRG